MGNVSTHEIAQRLMQLHPAIVTFLADPDLGVFEIY